MRNHFAAPVALLCLLCHAGAEVLPAEKALPDDTLLMLTLPDSNKVRDIFQNSPQGRFWNDPAMKDFKDKFTGKLMSDYITPLEHDLGVRFEDYTNLPQGQFTFALVQDGWQGKEGQSPALLFLLDTKDKSAQLKTNLADLKKKWVDAGKTVKTETIRDIDFSVISLSREDLPKSLQKPPATFPGSTDPVDNPDEKKAPKKQLYIGQAESLLIVGNSPKVIEKILVRMSGGSIKTISDLASFETHSSLFHDAPVYGWINVKSLVEVWNQPGEESSDADASGPLLFPAAKLIPALGLNGLNNIAFNCTFGSEGSQFNAMFAVPESDRTGLFKIVAGEAKDYNPPPFVPADAVKFQRWRISGQKTYATLRKILGDLSPTMLGGVDFLITSAEAAAKEKDPNFSLNKALFDNLGDDIITWQKSPKGDSLAQLGSPPSIFLISSPNPDQLASALKNVLVLYVQAAADPTDREFLGHKIYSIPLPAQPGVNGAPGETHSLNYASCGGYVAITSDTAMIEDYLRSSETPPKPLRDTPGLNDAAQKVAGAGASLFGYSNESQSMRVLFETLKKEPGSADSLAGLAPLAAMLGMNELKVKDWLDVSLLPDFDKVSKYFSFSVYGGSASADGLTFKTFAPTPPDINK